MNLRPSGYEPDELPDCSTPRQWRLWRLWHCGGPALGRARGSFGLIVNGQCAAEPRGGARLEDLAATYSPTP